MDPSSVRGLGGFAAFALRELERADSTPQALACLPGEVDFALGGTGRGEVGGDGGHEPSDGDDVEGPLLSRASTG